MAVKRVEVEGVGTVAIYKRRGLKSMRLSVSSDGSVRLSVPYYVPHTAAMAFVRSKQQWVLDHTASRQSTLQNAQPIGKTYTMRFVINFVIEEPQARLLQNEIVVNYPSSLELTDPAVQKAAAGAAVRALRREAEDVLPSRVAVIAGRSGFRYNSVVVKKLKGRWGSCDQDMNIVLNLFLMQLPWELIDYVILHELVHTKHMNHGDGFWTEFLHHEPDAKLLRKRIRTHQPNFVLPQA
jgi:predicted metal-dependent hydrolase